MPVAHPGGRAEVADGRIARVDAPTAFRISSAMPGKQTALVEAGPQREQFQLESLERASSPGPECRRLVRVLLLEPVDHS